MSSEMTEDVAPVPLGSSPLNNVESQADQRDVSPICAQTASCGKDDEHQDESSKISFEDFIELSGVVFDWSESYDEKDWRRLRNVLAPSLLVDYTDINGLLWEAMAAEEFVGLMSCAGLVADPLVHTQHHIGASKWQKVSDDEIIGHHQVRAAHQRYANPADVRLVKNRGRGYAVVRHIYRRVNGKWRIAGLKPTLRWTEGDVVHSQSTYRQG